MYFLFFIFKRHPITVHRVYDCEPYKPWSLLPRRKPCHREMSCDREILDRVVLSLLWPCDADCLRSPPQVADRRRKSFRLAVSHAETPHELPPLLKPTAPSAALCKLCNPHYKLCRTAMQPMVDRCTKFQRHAALEPLTIVARVAQNPCLRYCDLHPLARLASTP